MLVYTTTRELFFNFPQIRIIRSIYDIIVYPLLNLRSLLYSRALLIAVSTRLFRLARVDCSLTPRLSWNVNCTRAEEPGNEARLTVCVTFASHARVSGLGMRLVYHMTVFNLCIPIAENISILPKHG